ncbi:MAG: ATP-binding protein [Mycoplasmataceae bacterium]|nr:ATP-binding protein [Mycoplasmataceae bacterium]
MNKELSKLVTKYREKIFFNNLEYKREIFGELSNAIKKHNIVLIGLRQVGKTTLMEQLAQEYYHNFIREKLSNELTLSISNQEDIFYLNLKALNIIDSEKLINDISFNKYQLILIDEIQMINNWSNFLQAVIDLNPQARFIVSGSNASALKNETMVNRTKVYYVNPLSFNEFKDIWKIDDIGTYLKFGSYPRSNQYNDPEIQYRELVESSIIDKIIADDLNNKVDSSKFKALMKNMINYIGNELIVSNFESKIITRQTAKIYIEILARAQLIHLIPKYQDKNDKSKNKAYFEDKSMINFFNNFEKLDNNTWGALIENLVFCYLLKKYSNTLKLPNIFYYRGENKKEIDFLVESEKILIECKYQKEIDKKALTKQLNETLDNNLIKFRKIIVTKNIDEVVDGWEFVSLEKILRGDYGL